MSVLGWDTDAYVLKGENMGLPLPPDAGDVGLIPGQGAKIPHISLPKNQNKTEAIL